MEPLLEVALNEYGVAEKPGEPDEELILTYAEESSVPNTRADETPWCSIFMNWVAEQAGYESSSEPAARSWLDVGREIEHPVPGDVVVFWRESIESWKGHVGLYLGHSKGGSTVYCLGGNQDDSVDVTPYEVDRVLGYRRLRKRNPDIPEPRLEPGDTGPEVRQLQSILNQAGFHAGPVDGIFGIKTESGLKYLQDLDQDVASDGIYDAPTKGILICIL